MAQEEKQLLLKDLCTRLPHKQKVCYKIHDNSEEITETLSGCLLDHFKTGKIAVVKPYLRPMSSMTEKEKSKLRQWGCLCMNLDDSVEDIGVYGAIHSIPIIDYLNSIHVDCCGLIPMGLAIEAPEGMYKY